MTTLKSEFELTFKEGYRFGLRLTRSRMNYERARDCERLGDFEMAELYHENAKTWKELANNSGRQFTPFVAHDSNQLKLDLGDYEHVTKDEDLERKKA